jgi:hypothetical protein
MCQTQFLSILHAFIYLKLTDSLDFAISFMPVLQVRKHTQLYYLTGPGIILPSTGRAKIKVMLFIHPVVH